MRSIAAVACCVIAFWAAPAASAETRVIPETPGYEGVPFADNPSIIDPPPMFPESWSRGADDRAVVLHFTTGTPQCYGVHAAVTEAMDEGEDNVTVDLRGGTVPEALGRACILIAVAGSLEVPLANPLGARQVLAVA